MMVPLPPPMSARQTGILTLFFASTLTTTRFAKSSCSQWEGSSRACRRSGLSRKISPKARHNSVPANVGHSATHRAIAGCKRQQHISIGSYTWDSARMGEISPAQVPLALLRFQPIVSWATTRESYPIAISSAATPVSVAAKSSRRSRRNPPHRTMVGDSPRLSGHLRLRCHPDGSG